MPWKECHVMDERLRFVARLLEGEKMAPLCDGVRDFAQDRHKIRQPGAIAGCDPQCLMA